MGMRLHTYLPRIAVLVIGVLALTAGLTFAAGQTSAPPSTTPAATTTTQATLTVPDLRNQAFVFAKGQLQDGGFAWKIAGSVHGYAANTVVSQSPAPGTELLDTGSPLVTLTLARNAKYPQTGAPMDESPYAGTPLRLAGAAVAPATTAATTTTAPAPAAATTATTTTAAAPAKPKAQPKQEALPQKRPPAFVVPGAKKEPLDEIPLTARAAALGTWLAAHPKKSNANVKHWLFQNEWIVAGARMGWWHGAEALQTLITVDAKTQELWGIGDKSEMLARRTLAEVQARSG
jgi:PASTA domain-containing protein